MNRYFIAFTILSSFLFTACGSKSLLQDSHIVKKKEEQSKRQQTKTYYRKYFEYRIVAHDRVKISVYNHEELGTKGDSGILVDSSGNINLPLIGAVRIAGHTQLQASRKIQSLYGRYLKKSSVRLEVLNKKAYIIGEIKKAGAIELPNERIPLLQAIATAGGFSDYANKEKIIILRKYSKGTKLELVDLTNLSSLSHASMMIRPGDVIYVAPTSMKDIATNIAPIFKLAAEAMLPFVRYKDL
ncbi:MAG: polysaccharide export protein [Sulfurovum sp.]|nr:polysaccharide export protein [Sulfurovum sp.]